MFRSEVIIYLLLLNAVQAWDFNPFTWFSSPPETDQNVESPFAQSSHPVPDSDSRAFSEPTNSAPEPNWIALIIAKAIGGTDCASKIGVYAFFETFVRGLQAKERCNLPPSIGSDYTACLLSMAKVIGDAGGDIVQAEPLIMELSCVKEGVSDQMNDCIAQVLEGVAESINGFKPNVMSCDISEPEFEEAAGPTIRLLKQLAALFKALHVPTTTTTSTTTAAPTTTTPKMCKNGDECFGVADCGIGGKSCYALNYKTRGWIKPGFCGCSACNPLKWCTRDETCGGLKFSCNLRTHKCNCKKAIKIHGMHWNAFCDQTVCLKDNEPTCFGLPCNRGICSCN